MRGSSAIPEIFNSPQVFFTDQKSARHLNLRFWQYFCSFCSSEWTTNSRFIESFLSQGRVYPPPSSPVARYWLLSIFFFVFHIFVVRQRSFIPVLFTRHGDVGGGGGGVLKCCSLTCFCHTAVPCLLVVWRGGSHIYVEIRLASTCGRGGGGEVFWSCWLFCVVCSCGVVASAALQYLLAFLSSGWAHNTGLFGCIR